MVILTNDTGVKFYIFWNVNEAVKHIHNKKNEGFGVSYFNKEITGKIEVTYELVGPSGTVTLEDNNV